MALAITQPLRNSVATRSRRASPHSAKGRVGDGNLEQQVQMRVAAPMAQPAPGAGGEGGAVPAVVGKHRGQRPQVHGDVEGQALIRPTRQLGCQDEVGGAGDGQEFGDALQQRQGDCLQAVQGLGFVGKTAELWPTRDVRPRVRSQCPPDSMLKSTHG